MCQVSTLHVLDSSCWNDSDVILKRHTTVTPEPSPPRNNLNPFFSPLKTSAMPILNLHMPQRYMRQANNPQPRLRYLYLSLTCYFFSVYGECFSVLCTGIMHYPIDSCIFLNFPF